MHFPIEDSQEISCGALAGLPIIDVWIRVQEGNRVDTIQQPIRDDPVQIHRCRQWYVADVTANPFDDKALRIVLGLPSHRSVQSQTHPVDVRLALDCFQQLRDQSVQVGNCNRTTRTGECRVGRHDLDIVPLPQNLEDTAGGTTRSGESIDDFLTAEYVEILIA